MQIAVSTLSFLVLFIALRHIDPRGFMFPQGVALGAIVSALQLIVCWRKRKVATSALLKDGVITFLLIYTWLFTVPTQADRSFSLRLLQRLAEAPSGLSRGGIGQFYTTDFVQHGGLDRRLVEQQASGTVVEQNGRFTITSKGKMVDAVTRMTCKLFACQAQPKPQ